MANLARVSLSTNDKIAFIGNLSTMLAAGIPILEAVESLGEDVKGNQKKILDVLKDDLSQGKRVYTTMQKFPRAFDPVIVNVVRAAEEAGNLDVALNDLRETIRKEAEFSSKVKSALIYPAFIVVVFFMVLAVIIFFVIPKIATVFSRIKVDLPLPTRIMIQLSNFLNKNGIFVIIGAVIIGVIVYLLFSFKRKFFMQIFFSLPVITGIIYKIDLVRLSRSLHLLLASGIPITHALELVQDVTMKRETSMLVKKLRETVLAGKSLSSGLKTESKKVPSIMIKLIEAGEKTGTLDKSLQEVSEHFDYEVTDDLKVMTTLIEPIMLVVIGISVGGLMMTIIAPIYGLIGSIGNK